MAKIILKILAVIVIVAILLFTCAYFIFKFRGRDIIEKQLSNLLEAPVHLGTVSLGFPASIRVRDLEIKDFLETDIAVGINPLSLISGKVIINNIIMDRPELNLVRGRDGSLNLPFKPGASAGRPGAVPLILGLDIRDGHVTFVDRSLEDSNLSIYDFDVKITKRGLDLRPAFNFDVSARVGEKVNQTKNFTSSGWVDWQNKDMEGELEVNNLRGSFFYQFYKRLFGNGISEAVIDFEAKMLAKDNELRIDCFLRLSGLNPDEKEEPQEEEKNHKDILGFSDLFDIFSSSEGSIELDFTINTKLDNPKFNKIVLGPSLFKSAVKNIIFKPKEDIRSIVEGIGEKIEGLGKEGIEELKDEVLGDIFKIFK